MPLFGEDSRFQRCNPIKPQAKAKIEPQAKAKPRSFQPDLSEQPDGWRQQRWTGKPVRDLSSMVDKPVKPRGPEAQALHEAIHGTQTAHELRVVLEKYLDADVPEVHKAQVELDGRIAKEAEKPASARALLECIQNTESADELRLVLEKFVDADVPEVHQAQVELDGRIAKEEQEKQAAARRGLGTIGAEKEKKSSEQMLRESIRRSCKGTSKEHLVHSLSVRWDRPDLPEEAEEDCDAKDLPAETGAHQKKLAKQKSIPYGVAYYNPIDVIPANIMASAKNV